jgi:hypothetical protein
MARRKLPDHIPGSVRAWRVKKRRELQAVYAAVDRLSLGCAYSPIQGQVEEMRTLINSARQKLRGNWEPR